MSSIRSLLDALDERTIAQKVSIPHDEARMRYPRQSNTVRDYDEFSSVIGDYCAYHSGRCVSIGGRLRPADAIGMAREILEREYRRQNGNIISAFNDARAGTNSGLRKIYDIIAEGLKEQSVERYIKDAFDRHVTPNSWEQKVDMIRQFIGQCGAHLSRDIRADQAERFAQSYDEIIRAYLNALKGTSSVFRRL